MKKDNKNDFPLEIIMNKCLMFKNNFENYENNNDNVNINIQREIKIFNTEPNYLSFDIDSEELSLKDKVKYSFENNTLNKNKLECIKFTYSLLQKYISRTNKISDLSNSELINFFNEENRLNSKISKNNVSSGLNLNPWNFGYNVMLLDSYDCMTKEKYNLNALDNTFKDFKKNGKQKEL